MPGITVTLQETEESIARPIIYDIISRVRNITSIPDNVKIFYPGILNKMQQQNYGIDGSNDRSPKLGSDDIIYIEIDETYNKDLVGNTSIGRLENFPVFLDKETDVYLTPIYMPTDINVHFKYKTTSKSNALRWFNNMWVKVSKLDSVNLHSLNYHYPLPDEVLYILNTVYDLREKIEGYGDTLEKYITDNSSSRLTTISDLTGNGQHLVLSEKQSRVLGLFDFEVMPDKFERDETTGTYITSFSYKISYEKPISCFMHYPIMIHNQLMPLELIDFKNTNTDSTNTINYSSLSFKNIRQFEIQEQLTNRPAFYVPKFSSSYKSRIPKLEAPITLPLLDDFIINKVPPKTHTVFQCLCEIEPDKRTLLDLKNLDSICINELVLDYILTSEYSKITELYKSFFQVQVYREHNMLETTNIECTSDGIIRSKIDLNIRKNHRVRFSIVTDPDLLPPIDFPPGILPIIFEPDPNAYDNHRGIMKTVMTGYIIALKMEDVGKPLGNIHYE